MRDEGVETKELVATIPSKEVLLRSFLIPPLPKGEINTAVNFEARKFVPIKLEELYFDYLIQKTKLKGSKKLKTYFIGIKRDILKKFIYALEQSNLEILSMETSFMEEGGRNRIPEKLPKAERTPLFAACDRALRRTVEHFEPRYVVGIGKFAEKKARQVVGDLDVVIGSVPHPSPASPLANRGWAPLMTNALTELGILS